MGKLVDILLRIPVVASNHLHAFQQQLVALAGRSEAQALQSAIVSAFSASRTSVNQAFRQELPVSGSHLTSP